MAVSISISLIISGTSLLYQKYLFFDSLPQIDDTNNARSFELISIDNFLTQHDPNSLTLLRAEARERLFFGSGTYLMQLGVGTPPKYVYMSLDTGSDVIWLQCKKQFDPSNSSTFSPLACGDPRCKQQQQQFYFDCCDNNTSCLYNATYSDLSFSQGTFSTDTLTLGSMGMSLENIALGCAHENRGWLTESAGLIGLGRGKLSFITQTKHQFKSQFSYCLAFPSSSNSSSSSSSSVAFGPSAVPTRKDVYTPLIYTNITTTFYYVNLTGISVDGTPVPVINSSVFDLKPNGFDGGVIIDSGTAYTRLVKEAYVALRDAFREAIKNSSLGLPRNYSWFDTCYDISKEMGEVYVPTVELHFDKGANMRLGTDNTMTLMDVDDTVATTCFAFMSDDWDTTIGNVQQQSIRIVYDLPGSRIGFVPNSC